MPSPLETNPSARGTRGPAGAECPSRVTGEGGRAAGAGLLVASLLASSADARPFVPWWLESPPPAERSIEANVAVVRSPRHVADDWDRARALLDIGHHGTVEAAKVLLAYVEHEELGWAAVSGLHLIRAKEAVPLVAERLLTSDAALRRGLVSALGRIGGGEATAILLRVARDDDEKSPRVIAVWGLALELRRAPSKAVVEALLELAADPTLRLEALEGLRGFDARERVALLHGQLATKDAKARAILCEVLGNLASPSSAGPLAELIATEEDAPVRAEALAALARVATPENFDVVSKTFKGVLTRRALGAGEDAEDAEREVQVAARALGTALAKRREPLGPKVAKGLVELAAPLLESADASTRWSAALLLGGVAHPSAAASLGKMIDREKDVSARRGAIAALAVVAERAQDVQRLVSLASAGPDTHVAQEALATVRRPEALPALVRALEAESAHVRLAAVEALGAITRPGAAATALAARAAQDEDRRVRSAAARAVVATSDARVVPALVEGLRELKSEPELVTAVIALDRLVGFATVRTLVEKDDEVVERLLYGWGRPLPSDEPVLTAAARSAKPELRRSALGTLGRLGTKAAQQTLCEVLQREPDFQLRVDAARALGAMPSMSALRCLIDTLATLGPNDINVTEAVEQALHASTGSDGKGAKGPRGADKAAGWRAWLERSGLSKGIEGLVQGLQSDVVEVRLLAARELATRPSVEERRRALKPLLQALGERVYPDTLRAALVAAAGATGERTAVDTLLRLMREARSGDVAELARLAKALRALGDPRGVEALIAALDASQPEVRRQACEALAEVSGEPLHYEPERWRAWWRGRAP